MLGLAILQGCDVPTTSPEWDTRWVVPGDETTIDVAEFLPQAVSVAPGGTAFAVEVDPFTFSENLGDHCGSPCQALDGQVAPKPAFNRAFESSTDLPEDVVSVSVDEGTVRVDATNHFSFDPIRPGMGNFGSITLTLFDGSVGGRVIDQVVVRGEDASFSPGSTLTRTLTLDGVISSTVGVELLTDSPAGDDVLIDVTDRIDVTATPQTILVSSAVVEVSGEEVTLDPVELDVEEIGDSLLDKIQSGAIVLTVTNPVGVGVAANVEISGQPGPPIIKPVTIGAEAQSTVSVAFTADELRSFLGKAGVSIGGSGTVSSGSPPATLAPGQVVRLEATLDLVLRLGGEEGS